jgi:hypothetical protein
MPKTNFPFCIPSSVQLLEVIRDPDEEKRCDDCWHDFFTVYRVRNAEGEEAQVCGACLAERLGVNDA